MQLPESVAGDFVSLLARHRLTPVAAVAGGERLPQTEGTTVFAMQFREGVLVAGDRRATAGNTIVTDRVEKVLELDRISLMAIAGVPAMAFEMARVMRTSFEYYRRSQLQPMSLAAKLRMLSRLLRDNLPMTLQGIGVVVPLFAGVDALEGSGARPGIYFYDPLGAQFEAVDFAASGSGAGTVRSVLSFQERFGRPRPREMGLEEAVVFALRLLMVAAEFDSATAGVSAERARFATVKVLRTGGIETISAERQEALLRA